MLGSYELWKIEEAAANRAIQGLRPFVRIPVAFSQFARACQHSRRSLSAKNLFEFTNELFEDEVHERIKISRERDDETTSPCFIWVTTEIIGKDRDDDLSQIYLVSNILGLSPSVTVLVKNARIFHEYALAVGCAYAVREGVKDVLWSNDTTYAWV